MIVEFIVRTSGHEQSIDKLVEVYVCKLYLYFRLCISAFQATLSKTKCKELQKIFTRVQERTKSQMVFVYHPVLFLKLINSRLMQS